jgi:hypothetical protein
MWTLPRSAKDIKRKTKPEQHARPILSERRAGPIIRFAQPADKNSGVMDGSGLLDGRAVIAKFCLGTVESLSTFLKAPH